MGNKTSLAKSHSKASNAKLTFICFLAAVFFAALWIGLGLVVKEIEALMIIGYICLGVGAVGCILTFFLISKFTR